MARWTEKRLQQYVGDQVEESLTLEYKGAKSIDKTDSKKTEITKDVSAMANSAGGTIMYGIREYPVPRNHLPEKIDPIERSQFSKEWLEQVINNIRPRIDNVVIHAIPLSDAKHVCYVVEIPQSHTAHQATNHRYYKRFNFESVPMEDHEIRDVMNRITRPDASVTIGFEKIATIGSERHFLLTPKIKNSGDRVIKNFKLTVVFPRRAGDHRSNISVAVSPIRFDHSSASFIVNYQSTGVLFPQEERSIGHEIEFVYGIDESQVRTLKTEDDEGTTLLLHWTLYADDMTPKHGSQSVLDLYDF